MCTWYLKSYCESFVHVIKTITGSVSYYCSYTSYTPEMTTALAFRECGASLAQTCKVELVARTRTVWCYPHQSGFIWEYAKLIRQGLLEAVQLGRPRLLFSAHGLPKKLVVRADPHQRHVELSAVAIVEELGMDGLYGRLYSQICVARFGMNSILY